MLATLAFFVTAAAAIAYRRRRDTGWLLRLDRKIATRDLVAFLCMYVVAIGVSFAPHAHWVRPTVAVLLLLGYAYYAYLNLRESSEGEKEGVRGPHVSSSVHLGPSARPRGSRPDLLLQPDGPFRLAGSRHVWQLERISARRCSCLRGTANEEYHAL